MKKRVLFLAMGLCIIALAGGCGKKENTDELGSSTENTSELTRPVKESYKVSDHVTLGQYKGVEVTVKKLEVTEDDINDEMNALLESKATQEEVTGRPVENGDTVNIDFEGIMDGVAFEGGTAEGYDLTIGSGAFIPGFEEGIIGANIGDKLALELVFPDDYYEDKAGKPVTFNVTVNSIKRSKLPELTDSFIADNTDFDTIEAYKASIKTKLEEQYAQSMENDKINNIFVTIIDNAEIDVPESLIEYYIANQTYQLSMEAQQYGIDMETYVTSSGLTMEQYNDYAKNYAETVAKQELVLKAIAEAEKMEVSDEEFNEEVQELLANGGYKSEEELYKTFSKDVIKENILLVKAYDFVIAQAVVK